MTTPQVRQRNPFKFTSEIPEIDRDDADHILDEQEQEHVVEELRKENERLAVMYVRLGLAVLSVSVFLQILSFLGVTADAGIVSRAFNILHILLNLHGIMIIRGKSVLSLSDNTIQLPAFFPVQLLVLLQPLSSLLQSAEVDWIQMSPPALATLVAWVCMNAVDEGKRGVEALGGLMYEAKGA